MQDRTVLQVAALLFANLAHRVLADSVQAIA